jgi:hypothetical protein
LSPKQEGANPEMISWKGGERMKVKTKLKAGGAVLTS